MYIICNDDNETSETPIVRRCRADITHQRKSAYVLRLCVLCVWLYIDLPRLETFFFVYLRFGPQSRTTLLYYNEQHGKYYVYYITVTHLYYGIDYNMYILT
jgi:hypothetical protein